MTDTRVADRYEPLEVIGRGGEATVLKAVDTRHERLVALKVRVVPPNGSSDDLLTEARALLSLPPHPGLAHARDDLFDDGRHVLVLDWVEGVNLARLLADEGRSGAAGVERAALDRPGRRGLDRAPPARRRPRRRQAGQPDPRPRRPGRARRPRLVVGAVDRGTPWRDAGVPGAGDRRRGAGGSVERCVRSGGDGVHAADRLPADGSAGRSGRGHA